MIVENGRPSCVPIVMSADENYAPFLGVTLYSVLKNANTKCLYDFTILHSELSDESMYRLREMFDTASRGKHARLSFVNISDYANLEDHESLHLSIATVYRLFIPEILPQYEKTLYLDCDIVVLDDVSKLLEYKIGDSTIAAARDLLNVAQERYYEENVRVSPKNALNAGVLVINHKRFLEEEIRKRGIQLLEEDWRREKKRYLYMDNDILNILCEGSVYYLPMEWNLQWWGLFPPETGSEQVWENNREYQAALKDPKIIHYSSAQKPWSRPELRLAIEFWKYAKETAFYEEILMSGQGGQQKTQSKQNPFTRFVFPFKRIAQNSEVVIYGAGEVGKAFVQQNRITDYCKIVLWVDRNCEKLNNEGYPVSAIERIVSTSYDYVVIAVESETTAGHIKGDLVGVGVPEDRIVWQPYSVKAVDECG